MRLGDLRDARQAAPVPRARLTLRRRGRLSLDRGVLRDIEGRLHHGARPRVLRGQRLNRLVVSRALGELVLQLDTLVGVHREQIEHRECDREPGRPVRHLRPETGARQRLSWHLCSAVSASKCRLKVEVREVRAIEHSFARTHGFNDRQPGSRRRMRCEISRPKRRRLRDVRQHTSRGFDVRPGCADGISQRGSGNVRGLNNLTELILGNRQLGICS